MASYLNSSGPVLLWWISAMLFTSTFDASSWFEILCFPVVKLWCTFCWSNYIIILLLRFSFRMNILTSVISLSILLSKIFYSQQVIQFRLMIQQSILLGQEWELSQIGSSKFCCQIIWKPYFQLLLVNMHHLLRRCGRTQPFKPHTTGGMNYKCYLE